MLGLAGLAFGLAVVPGLPRLPAVTACLPLVVWAAVRLGPPGAAAANLLTGGVSFAVVSFGGGLPAELGPLAVFTAVSAATSLCLGAVIAERDRALRATADGREEYRRIVDTAQEGVLTIGPDGRIRYANRRLADLLGYDPQDLVGREMLELIDPADRPASEARLEDRRQGIPGYAETRLLHKDGRSVWVQASSNALYEPDGELAGVLAMVTDLTARKAAEAAVGRSESRYRNLFENAPVAIWEEDLSAVGEWFTRLRTVGVTDLADYLALNPTEAARAVGLIQVRDANRAASVGLRAR
jgi:PAS domain S-box-containing protein